MGRNERMPGEELGGYEVLSTLGSGASGTVYRAKDGAGELVALKVLHPLHAASEEARVRLMREVAALQKVSHPAVARVLDAESDGTEPFLVTELIDGPSLEDEVMGGGPFDPADLYEFGQELVDALRAVHAVGLVHRDVKPSNILVTEAGPVLIDFGIAQELADARLTSHGFVMGTPGYLAPQMLDGEPPTAATDWWGWAASLVFAATGRAPFGVRPLETVLARVRSGTPDLAGLGPITQAALAGALNPDPAMRLEPDDVLAELRRAAESGEEHHVPAPLAISSGPAAAAATAAGIGPTVPAYARDAEDAVGGAATGGAGEAETELTPLHHANPGGLSGSGPTAVMPTALLPDHDDLEHRGPFDQHGAAYDGGRDAGDAGDAGHADDSYDEYADVYDRPRHRRRRLALLALAVPPVLAAGLFPVVTAIVVLGVVVLLRAVGVTADALHSRREVRGVRRSDGIRHTLLFPWYLLRAFFGVIPAALVAASSAVLVLGSLWWLLQTNRWVPAPLAGPGQVQSADGAGQIVVAGSQNESWVFVAALCVTALLALVILWFGPLTRTTRDGARITLNHIAPGGAGMVGILVVVLAVVAVLVLWFAVGKPTAWWPFDGPPDLS